MLTASVYLGMKPLTEQHLAVYRRHMVEIIDLHYELAADEIGKGAPDANLRRALLQTPRHMFVPEAMMLLSYQDTPLPIGFDKTVSQPFIGALMLDLLDCEPGARILEVGTGLGFQAAVLSEMGAEVYSVEVVEEFAEAAIARFHAFGYNVQVRVGDGSRGWPEHAPFDGILVTAAAATPPAALLDQLTPGGRMVLPIGSPGVQQLSVLTKQQSGEVETREIMPVKFTQLETTA
jgi:protein-L-isoaspartate(D-aspartate) O-methyltransferase